MLTTQYYKEKFETEFKEFFKDWLHEFENHPAIQSILSKKDLQVNHYIGKKGFGYFADFWVQLGSGMNYSHVPVFRFKDTFTEIRETDICILFFDSEGLEYETKGRWLLEDVIEKIQYTPYYQ